jgi:hypothetical protein
MRSWLIFPDRCRWPDHGRADRRGLLLPVLAKYSLEGVLFEDPPYCPECLGRPECTARTCFYIISTIRASRMPQDRRSAFLPCPEVLGGGDEAALGIWSSRFGWRSKISRYSFVGISSKLLEKVICFCLG